jgi:hypothetical protein
MSRAMWTRVHLLAETCDDLGDTGRGAARGGDLLKFGTQAERSTWRSIW